MSDRSTTAAQSGGYIVFNYLYCDASNYKAFGSVWLTGTLTGGERAELIRHLESGEFFVAEQIGVPPLYSTLFGNGGGPTEDDHAWHMFEDFCEKDELAENAEVWGEASSLLTAFRAARENWQPELSPNFYCQRAGAGLPLQEER